MLKVLAENIPKALKQIPQWVAWRQLDSKKLTVNPQNEVVSWKTHWSTFEQAYSLYEKLQLDGVGFVLTDQNTIVGIDLDDSLAAYAIPLKSATYTELSPSGTGIRAFGIVPAGFSISKHPAGLGVFTKDRWLSVTGQRISTIGQLADCSDSLELLTQQLESKRGYTGERLSRQKLRLLLEESYRARKIWNCDEKVLSQFKSLSEVDASFATIAIKAGWSDDEVCSALVELRERFGKAGYDTKDKEEREDYLIRTVQKFRLLCETSAVDIPTSSLEEVLHLPEQEWFVDKIMPIDSVGVLWGRWATGKTFISLDLSLRIVCEMDWFGKRTIKPGGVLYVLSEGKGTLGSRTRAWFEYHPGSTPLHSIRFWYQSAPQLTTSADAQDIIWCAKHQVPNCRLIVIDTLSRSLVGEDENTSKSMSKVMDICTRIAQQTGATLLLVHHATKPSSDQAPTARGSSALLGAVDFSLEVRPVYIPRSKTRPPILVEGLFEIRCDKSKGAKEFEPFPVYLHEVGDSAVVSESPILNRWVKKRRKGFTVTSNQLIQLMDLHEKNLAPSTIEKYMSKNGPGLSRERIESFIKELRI